MKRIPDMTISQIESEINRHEKELAETRLALTMAWEDKFVEALTRLVAALEKNLALLRLLKELKETS